MKQLCTSKITEGEYDSLITFLIKAYLSNHLILCEMMKNSRGHENPKMMMRRIQKLRDEHESV